MESPSQTSPPEAVSLDRFVQLLLETGLLPTDEVKALAATVPAAQRKEARAFAQELMKQGKLTKYQASMIYAGKSKGLVLGNYAILDKIGQGGMGMVFKAQHRKLPRVVAIKVLPPAVTKDANAVKRFEREVHAAAQLNHANIVAARDAGQDQGVHFLVMEFVDGTDLAQLVKAQGPLPVSQAVDCILQAARGLAYAHQSGIIHRDIKPHNLLLGKNGAVKILDMGLARFDGGENNASTTASELTKSGSIMGTVDYMAPEQAVNTKKADHRSDIYSLGCTLYYLLVGNPLYGGETSMEKLLAHREEPIPPLPNASRKLQAIYQKMVAKKSGDRYQSMAQVIADLEACQASGGAEARLTTPAFTDLAKQRTAGVHEEETQPNIEGSGTRELRERLTHGPSKRLVLAGAAVGGTLVVLLVLVLALWPSGKTASTSLAQATKPAGGSNERITNSLGMKLALIPPGKFLMGSPDSEGGREGHESPQHEVAISKPFYLGAHEVTVGQFRAFVDATGHKTVAEKGTGSFRWENNWIRDPRCNWRNPVFDQTEEHPVACIDWDDAVAFCIWLSKKEGETHRLPTEAEWEYACRASSRTAFSFGDKPEEMDRHAWHLGNAERRSHPVGQLKPNAWGLYDMHGNVWEWCLDWFENSYPAINLATDPVGPPQGSTRVRRGGGWSSSPKNVRCAMRRPTEPGAPNTNLGFRVVREP